MGARSIQRTIAAVRTLEGAGFVVRRPFPVQGLQQVDPFLLLDEMGPTDLRPGEARGAPDHPHRGFETVSYILEGALEHQDSVGNRGRLGPGDVQWMTAGSGVVHSEMPAEEMVARGGRMHGFQVWVNLPRADKMMRPRYQDVPASRIPTAVSADGKVTVKVIAGEALGKAAVIDTRIPIQYLHFILQEGAEVRQPVPAGHTACIYVFEGRGVVGEDRKMVQDGDLALLRDDGDHVLVRNESHKRVQFLLLSAQPLKEPMVRHGPFVMNTWDEVEQAFHDFQSGRMGRIG
ncbi:MAG: pirin family protein [Deltaproteobacteria bacterium]|nr:pirin family protein [Deltaproteobacteria bacterium]